MIKDKKRKTFVSNKKKNFFQPARPGGGDFFIRGPPWVPTFDKGARPGADTSVLW